MTPFWEENLETLLLNEAMELETSAKLENCRRLGHASVHVTIFIWEQYVDTNFYREVFLEFKIKFFASRNLLSYLTIIVIVLSYHLSLSRITIVVSQNRSEYIYGFTGLEWNPRVFSRGNWAGASITFRMT